MTVASLFALRAVVVPGPPAAGSPGSSRSSSRQGLIGFVQYFTHLPAILVGFHMVGAALVSARRSPGR